MNSTQQAEINSYADEIFSLLKASKVNVFLFFAYTGIKAIKFSEKSLYLKLPKNSSKFKSILVPLDLARDTYIVAFYTHDVSLKFEDRYADIYFDQLVELIVKEMGIF